jgi:poly-gamma-glutamate capsule biosynthesis protein CapA/YwtB (metallophosphatase superfamily)
LSVYDDPGYSELFADIRNADAAFTNFETLIHNYELPGNAFSGGAYQTSPPWITEELKWAGFNLLSVANNHSFDFGLRGLRSTLHALEASRLQYAGAGENLALARTPTYLDTKHGRVALVACASTFTPRSQAGEHRPDLRGRPGISPLRFISTYTVDKNSLDGLRQAIAGSGSGEGRRASISRQRQQ